MLTFMTTAAPAKVATFEQISDTLYERVIPEGYVVAEYNAQTGNFYVADIFVEPDLRRRGIGGDLLQSANDLAMHLGARTVLATITSRESYEIFRRFYGAEYLSIVSLGRFEDSVPTEKTKVSLSYSLLQK